MRHGFLINGLLELLAGIFLYFNPEFLISGGPDALAITKMYGIIASVFGGISLMIWKNYEESKMIKSIYLFIMGFHMVISFYTYGLFQMGLLSNPGAPGCHLVVFVILVGLYLKEIKN